MAKTLSTTRNVYKIFGIKVCEFTSDYVWRESTENCEEIRDDIFLHEQVIKNLYKKPDNEC